MERVETRESAKRSVGQGWHTLIDELFDRLLVGVVVLQVKEKFGVLTIYIGDAPLWCYDLVDELERRSASICEQCGKYGEFSDINDWWRTLCKDCERAALTDTSTP